MDSFRQLFLLGALLLHPPTLSVQGGTRVPIWAIGRPDRSYDEFAVARNYGAFAAQFGGRGVVFEIGRGNPATDWPFIHPCTLDGWAGGSEHPYTIRFALDSEPRGLFVLRLDLVDVHAGSPPTLVVKTGGQTGRVDLLSGAGDSSLGDPAAGKPQQLDLALPANCFHQGTNEIVLSTVGGSWMLYDALTLLNDPEVNTSEPEIQDLAVAVTPLHIRQGAATRRVLKVTGMLSVPTPEVQMQVEGGGETSEYRVAGTAGFGRLNEEVTVPSRPDPLQVTVRVRAGKGSKSATATVTPGVRWKIFVGASSHTDVGYTDLQPRCAERHNENTDRALALMDKDPGFKWNLEVAWQAERYLAARPRADVDRFLSHARSGRLGVQSLYCNLLTALCSHEAACRATQYAYDLKTRYGIPYRSAMITDVPSQEATFPMLMANAGIRYVSNGINNDRAYPFTTLQDRCPAWWEGPDGSRVLMMWTWAYAQASQWGLTTGLEAAKARIIQRLADYEQRPNYPYDAVWLHGATGDNTVLPETLATTVAAWNERYDSPQIILCHGAEFFEHIETNYGAQLPVVRGSAGAYWEDGAASSAAETRLCRNAEQTVARADTFLTLASSLHPETAYPAEAIAQAWRDCLLYDEHTWGAHCSISQPDSEFTLGQWAIKARFATDADRESRTLLSQAADSLASLIRVDAPSLAVFNPAGWSRSDIVRVRLPEGMTPAGPGVVCCRDGEDTLLLARDLPPCGYRTVRLERGKTSETAQSMDGTVLESRFYRVKFDPQHGAIVSIQDKAGSRELVDRQAPYGFNQYLYVAGGDGSRIVMNEHGPEPKLKFSTPEKATLRRQRLGRLGERMIVETSTTMTPRLVTEVTVWNDLPRVDIVHRFTKTATTNKEAVYFAFPFAGRDPVFRYECPAGVVNASQDMLPGACLDWFAVQQFVEIESLDGAVVWSSPDAPLACFQDVNRGRWLRQLPGTNSHVYGYVMNNYWHTNYKARQGGDHEFRFSLSSRPHADSPASARFGWEIANPLLAVPTRSDAEGSLPAGEASLIDVREPNVLLLGARRADDGKGILVRLWETGGRDTTASIRVPHLRIERATACNLVGEAQGPLAVREGTVAVPLRASGLATVRLE